jgi:hypothetical protein
MGGTIIDRRFIYAWLGFAVALGVHVLDEATHDFLSTYNPTAQAIRARLPFLPLPTFSFVPWLTGLLTAVALLLCLSPFALRGARWIRIAAVPISVVIGVFNASLHILSSVYYPPLDAWRIQFAFAINCCPVFAGECGWPQKGFRREAVAAR